MKEGVSEQGENGVELEKFGDFSEAEWGIGNEVPGRRHASLREAQLADLLHFIFFRAVFRFFEC